VVQERKELSRVADLNLNTPNWMKRSPVTRGLFTLVAGGVAAVFVAFLPLKGLSYSGHGALGLLVLAVILWSSEALSLPIASLVVLLVQPLLGTLTFEGTLGSFANPIIFLLLGGFIIAEGVARSGLVTRFAYGIMSRVENPRTVLLITIFATGLLSAWVNNLVAFAIALPVARQVLSLDNQRNARNSRNFTIDLILGASYGSLAGGVASEIGTGPNLIAAAYANLSLGSWFVVGFPLSIVLMLLVWYGLLRIFPVNPNEFKPERPLMRSKLKELGPISSKEKTALLILVFVILLLATAPITAIDAYAVTLVGAVLFFLTGIITWKHAQAAVDWGVIVFFGSALSVGAALTSTGAATWIIDVFTVAIGTNVSPFVIVLTLMLVAAGLTQIVSNVGLAAIMVPIVTTLAKNMGLSPATFAVPVAVACSMSFMFPMSDPTIAMALGTGYVRSKDILKAGVPITLISVGISLIVVLSLLSGEGFIV
jgi:sodium-dependent dicarboxylate transporter 2/3/5